MYTQTLPFWSCPWHCYRLHSYQFQGMFILRHWRAKKPQFDIEVNPCESLFFVCEHFSPSVCLSHPLSVLCVEATAVTRHFLGSHILQPLEGRLSARAVAPAISGRWFFNMFAVAKVTRTKSSKKPPAKPPTPAWVATGFAPNALARPCAALAIAIASTAATTAITIAITIANTMAAFIGSDNGIAAVCLGMGHGCLMVLEPWSMWISNDLGQSGHVKVHVYHVWLSNIINTLIASLHNGMQGITMDYIYVWLPSCWLTKHDKATSITMTKHQAGVGEMAIAVASYL